MSKPKKQNLLNNKTITKTTYLSLAQAKAKAKESMKKKNVISTISRIAYFNSENNKKQCLGWANIQTVIDG